LDKFGLSNTAEIGVAIDDFAGNLKYRLEKEFSVDNLKEFFSDYAQNKLKPHIKSEPIPESQGPVKVVVGQSFNDIVLDNTKDVLFEMYAPWCGHCKKLEPIYNELAEKLSGIDSVVIAKMDATANDSPHPKYQAKGYPTIFFAPAGKKDTPMTSSGDRTVAGCRDYLKKNSGTGVFTKLSHKSAKNEFRLYPAKTVVQVFDNIVHSQEVLKNVPKSSSLVLKPWNDNISKTSEYRVFIEQRRIIALSQQAWSKPQQGEPETQGLLEALEELVPKLPYYDAVLDINYKDGKMELIEVNPGCIWATSGSSLFLWEELLKLIQQPSNEIPVRVFRN